MSVSLLDQDECFGSFGAIWAILAVLALCGRTAPNGALNRDICDLRGFRDHANILPLPRLNLSLPHFYGVYAKTNQTD
jgi:hypothetical protein